MQAWANNDIAKQANHLATSSAPAPSSSTSSMAAEAQLAQLHRSLKDHRHGGGDDNDGIVQDEPPRFQLEWTISLGFAWGMAVHPANGQVLVSLEEDGLARVNKLLDAEGRVLQRMQFEAGRAWGAAVDARRGLLMVADSKPWTPSTRKVTSNNTISCVHNKK